MKRICIEAVPIVMVACLALFLSAGGPGRYLDRFVYDGNLVRLNRTAPPENVVIVALDDNTFDVMADEMGGLKWPYPRAFHGAVLENLAQASARAVFLDVILDIESGFGPEDDKSFIRAFKDKDMPVVLAGEYTDDSILGPLPEFVDAGAFAGNAVTPLDSDHMVRSMAGASGFPRDFSECLVYFTGRLLAQQHKKKGFTIDVRPSEQVLFTAANPNAPLSPPGFIHFHGPAGSFQTVSYYEVFVPELFEARRAFFEDKIVLIGRTISASVTPDQQPDVFPVPYGGTMMAGVEIIANAYATLAGQQAARLIPALWFAAALVAWCGLFVMAQARIHHPFQGLLILAGSLLLLFGANQILHLNQWVLMVSPFVFFSAAWFVMTVGRHYIRERDRRLLTQAQLFHYLPRPVAEHVMKHPLKLAMAGDRSRITLLFADIAGFTTLSESHSPDIIIPMLQEHLKDMNQAIFDHQGTLDKYIGDGIMAFWGAPAHQDNQADLALAAARAMLASLDLANQKRQEKGFQPLFLRIGLHTGDAVVGNIGSDLFIDYTAIGDNVNTASRIEGTGRYFNTRLTISHECITALKDSPPKNLFRLGNVAVKGRKTPLQLYTLAETGQTDAFNAFEACLDLMDQRQDEAAKQKMSALLETFKEFGPARFHLSKFNSEGGALRDENQLPFWRLEGK